MTNNQLPITIPNALTIDVEDYFHVSAFESVCPPESWEGRECRVEANTRKVLGILAEAGVRATFFVLGWVAERYPGLVREIAAAGHELASHGYGHRRVTTQTREEFRDDVRRAKTLLEDLTGEPVLGYRAPSYSIGRLTLWAFDELLDAGYAYDSSVFPVRHDLYGLPDWPRFPFWLERLAGGNWVPAETSSQQAAVSGQHSAFSHQRSALSGQRSAANGQPDTENLEPGTWNREPETRSSEPGTGNPEPGTRCSQPGTGNPEPGTLFFEIPITPLRLLGRNIPIAGGGYFRLLPYELTRLGLLRINSVEGRPFVFYLHPWELDPEQPRIEGAGLKSRFRHYLNLDKTEGRARQLLRDFRFGPMHAVHGFGPTSRPAKQQRS